MSSETAANATPAQEQGPRIHLGNLSFDTKYETLQEKATSLGVKPKSVEIPVRKSGRPSGFAFLHFDSESEVQQAMEKLKDLEVDGRKLRVSAARTADEQAAVTEKRNAIREGSAKKRESKTPRRRQPGQDSEAEGETTVVDDSPVKGEEKPKPKRKTSRPKKATKKAKEAKEARIDGDEAAPVETVAGKEGEKEKKVEKKEKKPRQPKFELTGEQSPNTIFVANLPFNVDDEALAAVFTNLSIQVKSAKVVVGLRRNRSGRPFRASRGFGFVEIQDPSQQKEAVEKVEGTLIGDRKISAKVANELKPIEKEEINAAAKEGEVAA